MGSVEQKGAYRSVDCKMEVACRGCNFLERKLRGRGDEPSDRRDVGAILKGIRQQLKENAAVGKCGSEEEANLEVWTT